MQEGGPPHGEPTKVQKQRSVEFGVPNKVHPEPSKGDGAQQSKKASSLGSGFGSNFLEEPGKKKERRKSAFQTAAENVGPRMDASLSLLF